MGDKSGTKELNNSMTKTSERGTGNCICRLRGFYIVQNVKNLFPTNKKQLSCRESYKKYQIIVMNCS